MAKELPPGVYSARGMKRIATAAVLIPLAIVLVFWAPFWAFTVATAIVAVLALWEYLALADKLGANTPRIAACVAVAVLFAFTFRFPDLVAPLLGAIALALLILCAFRSPLERALPDAAYTAFGVFYVGWSLSTLPLIDGQENGPSLLLFLFFAVWSGDIAALYIGRLLGRRKLAPRISPGKTWAGSIASLAASALATVFLLWLATFLTAHSVNGLSYPGTPARWIGLSVLLNAAAQVGDLIESAIKRGAGVKDSGNLLPGHGGMLDRVDALLLAAPVLWIAQVAQQYF
jgi:phosphatidate cytidylyltransferase